MASSRVILLKASEKALEIIKEDPEIAWTVLTKLAIKTQLLDEVRSEMMHPEVMRTIIENKKKGL